MRMTLFLAAVMLIAGCGPFRRAKTPPPPGPTPARIPDQVASIAPAPPPRNLPTPPAIGGGTAAVKPAPPDTLGLSTTPTVGPPRPVRPKKAPAKRAATPPPAVAAPATPPVEASPEPLPYRLGELRSADEKAKLRRQTERLIGECTAALTAAEGRSLTTMQTEMVGRVKSFTQQAREAMNKDPGEAKNFAAKGRTFAEALLAELK